MNASSESGECATVIVRVSVEVDISGMNAYGFSLDSIVNRISLDSFKPGIFDERDNLLLAHLDFVVCFDRVAFRKLAAFCDRAVEVVCAVVQRGLRQTFTEHDPVGFDVLEVV